MSRIVFDTDVVQALTLDLKNNITKLSACRSNMASVRGGVDSGISARRGIGARMYNAETSFSWLEARLKRLEELAQAALTQYKQVEEDIVKQAQGLGDTDSKALWNRFEDYYYDLVANSSSMMPLRNAALALGSAVLDTKKWMIAAKDLRFHIFQENGNTFLKIVNNSQPVNYKKYRDLLSKHLGGAPKKWDSRLIEKLVGDGLFLYGAKNVKNGEKLIGFAGRSEKFKDTTFKELKTVVTDLGKSRWIKSGKAGLTAAIDSLPHKPFIGWSGAHSITKVGKGAGILGVGLTAVDNVFDNFYNAETGKWDWKSGENYKEFGVDVIVDVAAGASAAFVGGAIGTALVPIPPLGTIVGAAVGAGIYYGLNHKFGDPPQSMVDRTKNTANEAVDWAGKQLGKLFW